MTRSFKVLEREQTSSVASSVVERAPATKRSTPAAKDISTLFDWTKSPSIEIEPVFDAVFLPNEQVQPTENETDNESDAVPINLFEDGESEHEEEEMNWLNLLGVAIDQIDDEPADSFDGHLVPSFQHEVAEIEEIMTVDSAWFPFVNKDYLIGSLFLGYLHKIISRDLYHQIRSILTLHHINLPGWEALRRTRQKIRLMSHHSLVEKESVFGQPMFALNAREIISDDLRNPLVAPHLDFLPEDARGKGIFKTSQSAKWLKHLAPDIRVQMVAYNQKHYYTYEPVQLKNDDIIIPIFFYTLQSNTFAKCYKPQITSNRHDSSTVKIAIANNILYDDPDLQEINLEDFDLLYSEIVTSDGLKLLEACGNLLYEQKSEGTIKLPNPWREKANGRIIRHVPVNMYCDDTSGNKSKKWNKHISYYFSLSGLPPNLSNQQFNCHFLCTSNIAGANASYRKAMQTDATKLWCIASHRFADAILIHCIEESDASDAMRGPASLLRCDAIKARYDAIPMHASHQFHRCWSSGPWRDCSPTVKCIESGLNCQHNCDRGRCVITPTEAVMVERRKSTVKRSEVKHNDDDNYVINSASLLAQVSHRKISGLNFTALQPLDWINALHDEVKNWSQSATAKESKKRKRVTPNTSGRQVDPSLI
ncbi:hypothetical protein PGT21_029055 [Puccinia graminis f. sp. tritici]|uniref:Uncharacterized protein n=1 Tax=Puccinia graminis f. sp. tritici TaxID=56615 RepID=A0A5B0NDN6_PUCGR|nr:hypothetical protein PGT21_029055 [Puccinia graminis f. sp. tritici]